MAKVLFTALFPRWQCHAVAEANFMEEHIAAGDEIAFLACDASLKACDANPWRALPHCLACCGLRDDLISRVSSPVRRLPLVAAARATEVRDARLPAFSSMGNLRDFEWNGVKAGKEVVSSLITATGDSHPDVAKNALLISALLRDYISVYLTAIDYLRSHGFEKVYVFNGRFVPARAWIRACENRGVSYVTQERLGSPDRVLRVENGGIHDTSLYARRIMEFWKSHGSDPAIVAAGENFFEERPKGQVTGWQSFVGAQTPAKLPDCWDQAKRNMAIFSSTESEFMGLPEYFLKGSFPDQRRAFRDIAEHVHRLAPDIHFYLRVHPNSKDEAKRWWEDTSWKVLRNLTVIPPDSPVSSYSLMSACEKTVVWLTTMGVEATYWGKPSVLLGKAFYRGVNAAYEPCDLEEAAQLVAKTGLLPKPRSNALAYGGFIRCGIPKLPFSEALSTTKLNFKGAQPQPPAAVLRCLWRWDKSIEKAKWPAPVKRAWEQWHWFWLHNKIPKNPTGS